MKNKRDSLLKTRLRTLSGWSLFMHLFSVEIEAPMFQNL